MQGDLLKKTLKCDTSPLLNMTLELSETVWSNFSPAWGFLFNVCIFILLKRITCKVLGRVIILLYSFLWWYDIHGQKSRAIMKDNPSFTASHVFCAILLMLHVNHLTELYQSCATSPRAIFIMLSWGIIHNYTMKEKYGGQGLWFYGAQLKIRSQRCGNKIWLPTTAL